LTRLWEKWENFIGQIVKNQAGIEPDLDFQGKL
jgi:hypothetical protein